MLSFVTDPLGHEIYLTDERWAHVCEEHQVPASRRKAPRSSWYPEMQAYESEVLEMIQRGRRFQDSLRPEVFVYYRDFENLSADNTTIVAVVGFGFKPDGAENNFVVTAYQVSRQDR